MDLYIFVDESGSISQSEHFTVASCWCLSDHGPHHILSNARADLAEHIRKSSDGSREIGELKGTRLPNERLGEFLQMLEEYAYVDGTVSSPPSPWKQDGRPLVCSTHEFDPSVGTEILSEFMPHPNTHGALLTLALANILNPLGATHKIDISQIDRVRLILDADVWSGPASDVQQILADRGFDLDFETRDSATTPGIQVADLMAYSSRRYTRSGDCEGAVRFLNELHI
jgi:hypothetical protein